MSGKRIISTKPLGHDLQKFISAASKDHKLDVEVLLIQDLRLVASDFFGNFTSEDLFWLRWLGPSSYQTDPKALAENFAASEFWNLAQGLEGAFPRDQFINPPAKALLANSKPLQLMRAREVGLHVPRTLITSSVARARAFIDTLKESAARCIVKPIDTTIAQNPDDPTDTLLLFTKEIVSSELGEVYGGASFGSPVIIQELVDKSHELRAIAFGGSAAAISIDSQRHEDSRLDWRWRQSDKSILSYAQDMGAIEPQLIAYLDAMGLDYGVFDIAVDRSGRPFFLECNPGGQWGAMDSALGGTIAKAFGDFLVQRLCALAPDLAAPNRDAPSVADPPSGGLSLLLYTLPGCEPCEVVKKALDHEVFEDIRGTSVKTMTLEEMRLFRKEHGRLSFPILTALDGKRTSTHRVGALSLDVEEERQSIRAWLDTLGREDEAVSTSIQG